MATWQQVTEYVKAGYTIEKEGPDQLWLIFNTVNGRHQMVCLRHYVSKDDEWLEITSPVGSLGTFDLQAALNAVMDNFIGGLVAIDDLVLVRHSAPMSNLDVNEFEMPMHMVVRAADGLEARLIGGDSY